MRHALVTDGMEFIRRYAKDDVAGLGAELAYRFLFALFPFAIFLASLSGFVAHAIGAADPTQSIMNSLGSNLPSNLAAPVQEQLQSILDNYQPGLLSFGAILALYAASGGMNALMKATTRAYEVEETRSFIVRFAFAILLTVLAGIGIFAAFAIFVAGSLVTQELAQKIGLGDEGLAALSVARWPIVLVLVTCAVALVYRYAGDIRPPWRWVAVGAIAFSILWVVATFGFAFYVSNFGRYNVTYGAMGGVIVLMLWFYLTSLLLVGGAEIVAVLVKAHAGQVIESRRAATTARRREAGAGESVAAGGTSTAESADDDATAAAG